MTYTPPTGHAVDFELVEYTPPTGHAVDFEMNETADTLIWIKISGTFVQKAIRAKVSGTFVPITYALKTT